MCATHFECACTDYNHVIVLRRKTIVTGHHARYRKTKGIHNRVVKAI